MFFQIDIHAKLAVSLCTSTSTGCATAFLSRVLVQGCFDQGKNGRLFSLCEQGERFTGYGPSNVGILVGWNGPSYQCSPFVLLRTRCLLSWQVRVFFSLTTVMTRLRCRWSSFSLCCAHRLCLWPSLPRPCPCPLVDSGSFFLLQQPKNCRFPRERERDRVSEFGASSSADNSKKSQQFQQCPFFFFPIFPFFLCRTAHTP